MQTYYIYMYHLFGVYFLHYYAAMDCVPTNDTALYHLCPLLCTLASS